MTCNIEIFDAFGNGEPLNKITVTGHIQECPEGIDGSNLEVELSCRSADDPQSIKRTGDINSVGNWEAIFPSTIPGCGCGDQVFVKARCLSVDGCEAEPYNDILKCEDCPTLFAGDDVGTGTVFAECDVDGSVLVKINFNFFNDSGLFTQARVNCGPGGTKVSADEPFVGPNAPVPVSATCRYNPATTPVPAPFVEFVNLSDFKVRGCPPVPIQLPPLPECENIGCPLSTVLEVTDSDGNVVIADGPNAALCFLPGQYTVTVISPIPQPSIQYSWSKDNALIQPFETGQSLTIDLGEGESPKLSVVILRQDCPALAGFVELTGCVIDCTGDLNFVLRDDQNNVVNSNQTCIPAGGYTLHVEGLTEPPWDFQWNANGNPSMTNTSSEFPFTIGPGEGLSIEVIASAPLCDDKSKVVTFIGCEKIIDDKPSCAALLLAAIGLLISGAILIIIGICTATGLITAAGAILAVVGAILLGLWFWFCRKTTSCTVLQQVRCLLFYAGAIFAFVSLLLGWISGIACGLPAILSSLGWFGIQSLITDVMVVKGCEINSCTF